MVVSCESKSLVARSVRLYNQCTSSMLRVNMTGAVAADNSEDGFENLVIESTDFSGKLIIYGELTKRYLCFNPRWKLIGSRRFRGALCTFTEETTSGGYYRYRSVQDKSKYLGFTKSGRQLRGRNSSPACLNWVKLDSKFSIPEHNELIRGTPRVSLEAINREMMAGDGAERAGRRRHRHRKHRLHRNN